MNRTRSSSRSIRTLAAIGALASAALTFGCNGAQLNVPPPYDAGPPCSSLAPLFRACDAGASESVATCSADPTSTDLIVAQIPAGSYPVQCQVQFYFTDLAAGGSCAPAPNPCTCLPADAGTAEDGGPLPGHWSDCSDAGLASIQ